MALKKKLVEYFKESDTSITITPNSGEALRIFHVSVGNTGNKTDYATLTVGNTKIVRIPCGDDYTNLIPHIIDGETRYNIFKRLRKLKLPYKIPVPEGKSFKIEVPSSTSIRVLAEVYDSGDVRPDEPNGPEAKERIFIGFGTNGNDISSTGYTLINTSLLPEEEIGFPFGEALESIYELELYDIFALAIGSGVGDGTSNTGSARLERILLKYFNTDMFTDREGGFIVLGKKDTAVTSTTVTYNYTQTYNEIPFRKYKENIFDYIPMPLFVFKGGDELTVKAYVSVSGNGKIEANKILFGYLARLKIIR